MAGAMRKMGIYLGLVEDDDAQAAYGRYDARQSGYEDEDGRPGRDDPYGYDQGYDHDVQQRDEHGYDDIERGRDGSAHPDAKFADGGSEGGATVVGSVPPRRVQRRLDLAPATGLGSPSAPRIGNALATGPVAATTSSTAVRERSVAVSPPVETPTPPTPKPYRIATLHPRTYNEARTIGERFRDGSPVIMNLTEMSDADAKRLVDFAAGLSFGLHGSIERVTAKVFLLSPQGTDVTAEDKARIRAGGFPSQS